MRRASQSLLRVVEHNRFSSLCALDVAACTAAALASGSIAAAVQSVCNTAFQQRQLRTPTDHLQCAFAHTQQHWKHPKQQQTPWVAQGWHQQLGHRRGVSASTANSEGSGSSSSSDGGKGSETFQGDALAASMDKLVDTTVSLVEEGKLQQAIEVLKQGIELLTSTFPDRAELSELHNQAALLLLLGQQHEEAAKHASSALEITQRFFGTQHQLTGHRLLRLGTIRVHAGDLAESQPLLATAVDMLAQQQQDPSLYEAVFYLHLLALGAAETPQDVAASTQAVQDAFKFLVNTLGADSMIARLALTAHSKLVGIALDQNLQLGEAAFKQHITLQEIQDPASAELGLTLYQLATTYYANDMLADAGSALQRAAALLKQHYPPEHDLVVLCKHRLGMICAAGRDSRSATLLLGDTMLHYKQLQPGHPLAHEAELGLAMARIKGLDPRMSKDDREKAIIDNLQQMRTALAGMAQVLGPEHLLVAGGSRYLAQLAVMTGHASTR